VPTVWAACGPPCKTCKTRVPYVDEAAFRNADPDSDTDPRDYCSPGCYPKRDLPAELLRVEAEWLFHTDTPAAVAARLGYKNLRSFTRRLGQVGAHRLANQYANEGGLK
jgi:hypothetical protein